MPRAPRPQSPARWSGPHWRTVAASFVRRRDPAEEPPSQAGRWASSLLVVLAFATLLWTFEVGRTLGMDTSLSKASPIRADLSIAAAISRLAYGAPGYLIYRPVLDRWHDGQHLSDGAGSPPDLNRGIQAALGLTLELDCRPQHPDACVENWGDDQGYTEGYTDYMILAFTIFGFHIESLYYLYFLIVALSLAVFALQFFSTIEYLMLAPLFTVAHHLVVILLPGNPVTSVVHDPHFVPVISFLAILHVTILLVDKARDWKSTIACFVAQIGVIIIVIDARTSALWIIGVPIGAFMLAQIKQRSLRCVMRSFVTRAHILAPVLAVPLLLSAYDGAAYDERYAKTGLSSHLIWHLVYMGLSVHPDANKQFAFTYTDGMSYLNAHKFLIDNPKLAQDLHININRLPFEPGRFSEWVAAVGWPTYERIVETMYLDFVPRHRRFVAETYLLYKPAYLAQQVLWQTGLRDDWPAWVVVEPAHVPSKRDTLDLCSLPAVLVVVVSVGLAVASGRTLRPGVWIGLTGLLLLASLLPGIVVAPVYYELPVVLVTLTIAVYAVAAALLVPVLQYLLALAQRQAIDAARARVAVSTGLLLGLAVLGLQLRLAMRDGSTDGPTMRPGLPPAEVVRDSLDQVWLLTIDGTRRLPLDWETYLRYGGSPSVQNVRPIDDQDLAAWTWAGLLPSASGESRSASTPPQASQRSPDGRVTNGPVALPSRRTNLAIGRPAQQSDGGITAALAVDGITSGVGVAQSVASSSGQQPQAWWQVDLGDRLPIDYIQIWPRTDACCLDRLNNFFVFVSDEALTSADPRLTRRDPGVTSFFALGKSGVPTTITVRGHARYVRIQMAHWGLMDIAEVQVWQVSQGRPARMAGPDGSEIPWTRDDGRL